MRPGPCPGPPTRRDFLHAGALALGGMTLPGLLRARAVSGSKSADTAVILLYLHGGPSHLETYDLKPAAPLEYRSVFKPIATNVPGIQLCEHFPLQAKLADKFALIRSLHHQMTSHTDGGIEVLTGKTPARPDPTSTSKSEHPDLGHIAGRLRGEHPEGMPHYVATPSVLYMTRPAYLGACYAPFHVPQPGAPVDALRLHRSLNSNRLEEFRALRRQFDRFRADLDQQDGGSAADEFSDRAIRLLTSPHTARAFDLGRESDRLRDRYGRNLWGQACLLARRLAEAGTAVTTLFLDTPKFGPQFSNWDDHIGNNGHPGHFAKYLEVRLPYLDQAVASLIEDICARGLDKKLMVVILGEFGRTPRLSRNKDGVGRDHWPDAYSVLVAGGGLRMGQVIGATSSKGEFPVAKPYSPKDLLATVYRHLGIDYRRSFADHSGRPVPILAEGRPIEELL